MLKALKSFLYQISPFDSAVYTFEDANHLMAFNAPSSTLERSSTHYKDGTHSMKWTWTSGNEFTHTISVSLIIYETHAICHSEIVNRQSVIYD